MIGIINQYWWKYATQLSRTATILRGTKFDNLENRSLDMYSFQEAWINPWLWERDVLLAQEPPPWSSSAQVGEQCEASDNVGTFQTLWYNKPLSSDQIIFIILRRCCRPRYEKLVMCRTFFCIFVTFVWKGFSCAAKWWWVQGRPWIRNKRCAVWATSLKHRFKGLNSSLDTWSLNVLLIHNVTCNNKQQQCRPLGQVSITVSF